MNKLIQLLAIENNLQLTNWTSPEVFYTNGLQEFHFELEGEELTISSWDMHCHCFLDKINLCLGDPQLTLKASKFIQTSQKPLPLPSLGHKNCKSYQKPQEEQNAKESQRKSSHNPREQNKVTNRITTEIKRLTLDTGTELYVYYYPDTIVGKVSTSQAIYNHWQDKELSLTGLQRAKLLEKIFSDS